MAKRSTSERPGAGETMIYLLSCPALSGNTVYIGACGRSLTDRLRTHERDAARKDTPVCRFVRAAMAANHQIIMRRLAVVPTADADRAEGLYMTFCHEIGLTVLNRRGGGRGTHTAEARAAMRAAAVRRGRRAWAPRPVVDLDTSTIYPTGHAAARALGLEQDAVSKVCRGVIGSTFGYRFAFVDVIAAANNNASPARAVAA